LASGILRTVFKPGNFFPKPAEFSMSKFLTFYPLLLIGLLLAGEVQSAETTLTEKMEETTKTETESVKGLSFTGYAEAGYASSWISNLPADSEFLLDNANVIMGYEVSDRTKVVVNSAFAIRPPKMGLSLGSGINSSNYYSKQSFLSGQSGAFVYAINEAYIANKFRDCFILYAGQFKTPFGMESMFSRYDMPSYYYSAAYNAAQSFNLFYDLGLKLAIGGDTTGTLEVAITDGKSLTTTYPNTYAPALSARYSYDYKSSDMILTPVFSAYLGEWRGSPQTLALSGGVKYKMGVLATDAEFVYFQGNSDPSNDDPKSKVWSVYLEPGFDLGIVQLSVKGEYNNTSTTGANATSAGDWNIGAALGHTYMDKYRIRLAYQAQNLSGNNAGHINDLRLLFGSKF
jgi:hypothetical protein